MIRLKVSLKPMKNNPINANYRYNLALICNNIISKSTDDFRLRLSNYNSIAVQKMDELLTFSQFTCKKYEIREKRIIFWDIINWYISSPIYELILHLAQCFFAFGSLKIGKEEFKILSIEAVEESESSPVNIDKDIYSLASIKSDDISELLADYYIINEEERISSYSFL